MIEKPKVAFYWCASCGGCEESVVDLAEDILVLTGLIDIVFWPVALDFKKNDVLTMADGSIAVSLINGSVRTSEQEEMVKLLRKKSSVVIAYGACAHTGGIPGLANFAGSRHTILQNAFMEAPSVINPKGMFPQQRTQDNQRELTLPEFYDRVYALDQVIDVDYFIPGCAPTPKLTKAAVFALLEGNAPAKGSVLASTTSLCAECELNATKPERIQIKTYKRIHEVIADRDRCFLAQDILCMGPVTRGGCEALCVAGAMPCSGCFGPLDAVSDPGAKAISTFAAAISATEPADIEAAFAGIPDPAGTFYRYSLAASILNSPKDPQEGGRR